MHLPGLIRDESAPFEHGVTSIARRFETTNVFMSFGELRLVIFIFISRNARIKDAKGTAIIQPTCLVVIITPFELLS